MPRLWRLPAFPPIIPNPWLAWYGQAAGFGQAVGFGQAAGFGRVVGFGLAAGFGLDKLKIKVSESEYSSLNHVPVKNGEYGSMRK